jgi:hypothetical protein
MAHSIADFAGVLVVAGVALALFVAAWMPSEKRAKRLKSAAWCLVVGGIVLSLWVSLHGI